MLKDIITGRLNISTFLCEYFDSQIKLMERNPEMKDGTISRYRDTLGHLRKYLDLEKKSIEILITQTDLKFIKSFELYLLNYFDPQRKKNLERNTVNKHLTRLKTILLKANAEGLIKENPFKSLRLKNNPAKRDFLTEDELERLTNLNLEYNPTLERVKDIFLWSVYTGLRFTDAQAVSAKEIVKDKKGGMTLTLRQGKTGEIVAIPLFKPAQKILDKYDNAERKITGKVLPQISNQKANFYLRHIATLVNINKPLSTHIARHTCATTILLSNKAPMEIVSKWLGHTNVKTTQIYAKITNDYLAQIANDIEKKLH
jgi:integrase/recombinase XerD